MLRKYLLPLVSALGLVFALKTVAEGNKVDPPNPPVVRPPANPYARASVAGAGIIEAPSENISVGAPVSGVVAEVLAGIGDLVEKGAPLFRLDDRALRAELAVRRAAAQAAARKLERLRALPRPETLPPLRARVAEARAQRDDLRAQVERWDSIGDARAVSEDERARKRYALELAERTLERVSSELREAEAGAWAPDVAVAESDLEAARAESARVETELDRLVVRAPVAGRVLQRNVRPGEFVQAGPAGERPPVLLGEAGAPHVRIDIDEGDAPLFRPGAPASANLRGRPDVRIPLVFVRVEPFVVPKRSLTGLSNERVDTRVLQVIYAVEGTPPVTLYVGQQVDAFIDAAGPDAATRGALAPSSGGRS
jgi:multidrug resistance efflux pump